MQSVYPLWARPVARIRPPRRRKSLLRPLASPAGRWMRRCQEWSDACRRAESVKAIPGHWPPL